MNDKNLKKPFVLLSEEELNNIASEYYYELIKLPIHDNNGRIEVIQQALRQTQNGIVKNIQKLDEKESKIVPELITFDILHFET